MRGYGSMTVDTPGSVDHLPCSLGHNGWGMDLETLET